MESVNKANVFLKENQKEINPRFRQHYHFMAIHGWINDPNGFVYHDGEYHIFYQHYPYGEEAGLMHWGHAKSQDLLRWEHLPEALAPDHDYDKDGCWSGSAIIHDGKIYILYTGHRLEEDGRAIETQNLAYSQDGINFEKYVLNPVISLDDSFPFGSQRDFRDPYVIDRGAYFEVLVGSKKDEKPKLLSYVSPDLINWSFQDVFYEDDELGTMFECPSFPQDGFLILSPQNVDPNGDSYWNVSSSVALLGSLEEGKFVPFLKKELDHGLEFYAPQVRQINGRIILIAWMQMWGRRNVLSELKHGWCNSFALPRELVVKGDKLFQRPIKEIERFIKDKESLDLALPKKIRLSSRIKISLDGDKESAIHLKDEHNVFSIYYDDKLAKIRICRNSLTYPLGGVEKDPSKAKMGEREVLIERKKTLELEIYLDRISIEIFVNGGEETLTSLCYFDEDEVNLIMEKGEALEASYEIISL